MKLSDDAASVSAPMELTAIEGESTIFGAYHEFMEAFNLRGEMIRRGAAERVELANRVAKLERENAELLSQIAKLAGWA